MLKLLVQGAKSLHRAASRQARLYRGARISGNTNGHVAIRIHAILQHLRARCQGISEICSTCRRQEELLNL
jgi:hypothetical protein